MNRERVKEYMKIANFKGFLLSALLKSYILQK